MSRRVIATAGAPEAIGPYSQATRAGNLIFLSGQIALDPETGQMIEGDIAAQTERVIKNLAAILDAAGSSLAQVLKTTVYLRDLSEFGKMNEVYSRFFLPPAPARATVQVAKLPKDAAIEIEAIAEL